MSLKPPTGGSDFAPEDGSLKPPTEFIEASAVLVEEEASLKPPTSDFESDDSLKPPTGV